MNEKENKKELEKKEEEVPHVVVSDASDTSLSKALKQQVTTRHKDLLPTKSNVEMFTDSRMQEAESLVKSGLLPDHVRKPEQAIVIMQKGKELGFSPMASFEHIVVISGKPSLDSAAVGTLLLKAGVEYQCTKYAEPVYEKDIQGEDRIYIKYRDKADPNKVKSRVATPEEIKSNSDLLHKKKIDIVTEIKFRRKSKLDGEVITHTSSFSLRDAETAGLTKNDTYNKYLKNMLFWRALAKGGREFAPDATLGMITAEELGQGEIVLDVEGHIMDEK